MSARIEHDHNRFRQIVRGKIKRELRRYMSQGELLGRQGKKIVSIPLPQIDLPRFVYAPRQMGGVGQGEGDVGDAIARGDGDQDGQGSAGDAPGSHILEVDVTLEELAEILGEELELPRIDPRGKKKLVAERRRYTGITQTGPESLHHFRRTYRQALKRLIASGAYDPGRPTVVPIREDRRYRSYKVTEQPEANAVIVYMMDVSGSMGDEQKEIVRIESFWIDTWLSTQYQGLDTRYVIHDAEAREVDRDTFYHTRESGGTVISSAYRLVSQILDESYPTEDWNIYLFHFSDGDNWSQGDTEECLKLLDRDLLERANLFCYGQVESPYGTGQLLMDLREAFPEDERLVVSRIENKDAIYQSIKDFLGKGV